MSMTDEVSDGHFIRFGKDDRRHMTPYGQFRRKMTCATMCYIVLQCATFGSRIRDCVIGTFTRENPFSS